MEEYLRKFRRRHCWRPSATLSTISPHDMLRDSERCLPFERLLPRIPDEITLDKVATKLSWKDIRVLSSVTRGWCHAIRSHQVYNARVRLGTRDKFALISYGYYSYFSDIVLYCIRDMSCYLPPPIPSEGRGGIPKHSECVALDGKVYVLGGLESRDANVHSLNVFVLDLAGHRQWQRCASMSVRRSCMKCGVINGKIFVFGNDEDGDGPYQGEVYDPKENTWSTMRAVMFKGFHHVDAIEALGQELVICGSTLSHEHSHTEMKKFPKFLVYYPVADYWGEQSYIGREDECPFVAQGSLHSMSYNNDICIYDVDRTSWRQLHTFSFAANSRPSFVTEDGIDDNYMIPICVKAVEGELFVLCHWYRSFDDVFLLHSKGFTGDIMEIELEKVPVDLFARNNVNPDLCSMSLLQI